MSDARVQIPDELLIDFDIRNDPHLASDPFARLKEVRGHAPSVAYAPKSGSWLVFGRAEMQEVLGRDEAFSSAHLGGAAMGGIGFIPLSLDPPEHAPWRLLLLRYFGPRQVEALAPFVREWAARIIAPLRSKQACDFVSSVAEPMPVSIFMILMGLPIDRFEAFRAWAVDALSGGDTDARAGRRLAAHGNIRLMLQDLIEERRLAPCDDLISHLLGDRTLGRSISPTEMMSICYLLFLAGLDTVTNAMAYVMRHLAMDAAMQSALRNDASLIPAAVERLLQLYTFVNTMRVAKRDCMLGGAAIRAGDLVWCVLWAGGNDGATRAAGPRHFAFGSGHHACLGMHLARLELRVMLEAWFASMGAFSLARDDSPTMRGGVVMAIERLLLTLEAP